nr:MAG: hypothetical protein [Molluscum contagiosum virus]
MKRKPEKQLFCRTLRERHSTSLTHVPTSRAAGHRIRYLLHDGATSQGARGASYTADFLRGGHTPYGASSTLRSR